MPLAYKISRHLSDNFCFGHNVGISASMSNEMVLIKVCCEYFKAEVEKKLIDAYGMDFVSKNIKFSCGGSLSRIVKPEGAANDQNVNEDEIADNNGHSTK